MAENDFFEKYSILSAEYNKSSANYPQEQSVGNVVDNLANFT